MTQASHMQTVQIFWSEAFQLNLAQLNFFERLCFDPNSSGCNSSWNMDPNLSLLFLHLVSDFLSAFNLSSNLPLASLAPLSNPSSWDAFNALLNKLFSLIGEVEEWWVSWLLVYKQRDDRLVPPWLGESDMPLLWWNRLLRAHSTPGSIPAIDMYPPTKILPFSFPFLMFLSCSPQQERSTQWTKMITWKNTNYIVSSKGEDWYILQSIRAIFFCDGFFYQFFTIS